MGSAVWQNVFRLGLVILAAWLTVAQLAVCPPHLLDTVLFFSILVLLVGFLRVRHRHGEVGFEAGAIFPAILLFPHPAVAVIPALTGLVISGSLRGMFRRNLNLFETAVSAARSTLAYFAAFAAYSAVSGRSPELAAMSQGYVALLATWLAVSHAIEWFDGALGNEGTKDVSSNSRLQARALFLITPLVAVGVLVYPDFGEIGLSMAFLPILLVAYAMTNEADTELRNVALSRRNRELSLLRDSSASLLSAEGDEETLRRLTRMMSSLLPMKACATVNWGSTNAMAVFRFGECHQTHQTIDR